MATILLVEDNEMNRDMLSRRLTRRGYTVTVAEDGTTGINLAFSILPDLILMDVGLPDIDGLEVTRRLKGDARTRGIPIVVLTAHAMAGDQKHAIDAGGDDYDTKPIDLARLLHKIEVLLARGGK
jgi:CheY-like chemotaxis protein